MKNLLIILVLMLQFGSINAQETSPEAEVRKLEEQERQAVLKRDTAALRKIWDRYLIVNGPNNKIVLSGEDAVAGPAIPEAYSSFTREIEQVLVRGDVVFCMGSEIVMPASDNPKEGDEIKRRYTNTWMKQNGAWTLVARHASIICEEKVNPNQNRRKQ